MSTALRAGTRTPSLPEQDLRWLRDEVVGLAERDACTHRVLGEMAAAWQELRGSVDRFLPALRDLEMAADAGIGVVEGDAREGGQAGGDGGSDTGFDPLELDVYGSHHELYRALSAQAADLSGLQSVIARAGRALEVDLAERTARMRRLRARLERAGGSLGTRVAALDARRCGEGACAIRYHGPDPDTDGSWTERVEQVLEGLAGAVTARWPGSAIQVSQAAGGGLRIQVHPDAGGCGPDLDLPSDLERLLRDLAARRLAIPDTGAAADDPALELWLPVPQSEARVLVLAVDGQALACPLQDLLGVQRRADTQIHRCGDGEALAEFNGARYPVSDLRRLGGEPEAGDAHPPRRYLAFVAGAQARMALAVDAIHATHPARLLPLDEPLQSLALAAAAAVLDDGQTLPLLDVERLLAHAARAGGAVTADTRAAPPAASQQEVLVVDDSVTIRKVSERLLQRHGYAVRLARDGREALDAMREHTPDLILLDIEMPRMNGFQLLEALSTRPRLAAIPVVMISSRSGARHRREAARFGVRHLLGKPFQEQQLLQVMSECLA